MYTKLKTFIHFGSSARSGTGYAVRTLPVNALNTNQENVYGFVPSRMDSGYGSVPISGGIVSSAKSALGLSSSSVPWIDETDKESNIS